MIPMVLDDSVKDKVKELVAYAEAHRVGLAEMQERVANPSKYKPFGDEPEFHIFIPMAFFVVFTIEEWPVGWVKHLSMSVATPDTSRVPHPYAVVEIMKLFGMPEDLKDQRVHLWLEERPGLTKAVNVVSTEDPAVKLHD
jgi:hypothetical protein